MAGPITRDAFICVEFSEMAPDRCSRFTSDGSKATHAGAFRR